MMNKFKVGDKIVGLKESNNMYSITNEKNGFVGEVVDVKTEDEYKDLKVKVLKANDKEDIGVCFWVNSKYFRRATVQRVYLASPFFDEKEIEIMEKVRDILREKGLEVFVPKENQNLELGFGSREWRKATFKGDIEAIDTADVVVAINCKGNYDDAGTMFEIGYSFAKEIPVILVNTTGETITLMIADSLHALVTTEEELKEYDFNEMPVKEYENYVW